MQDEEISRLSFHVDATRVTKRLIQGETKYIGIDIDYSTKNFVRAYFVALRYFPERQIRTELSSSGSGYHILIRLDKPITLLESLMYRCVLNDCSNRLKLSVARMVANVPGNHHFDLIFDVKNGKKVKPFDMKKLLKPHKERVERIIQNWGDVEVEGDIKIIADDIDDKLPKKELWTDGFNFKGEKLREIIARISDSARTKSAMKGESPGFRYMIKKNVHPDWDYVFAVFGRDANHAYKRATYIWFNAIKEMGLEDYNKVKELLGKNKAVRGKKDEGVEIRGELAGILTKIGISLYWKPKKWC